MDVGSIFGVRNVGDETAKRFGKTDVFISNADILLMIDLEGTTEADFDKTLGLNVKGP